MLYLHPLQTRCSDDGRKPVELKLSGHAVRADFGRSDAGSGGWSLTGGISDPRVSRAHLCLQGTLGPSVGCMITVSAIGTNSVVLVRGADGKRCVLKQGEAVSSAEWHLGDALHCVNLDQPGLPMNAWGTNPCAYLFSSLSFEVDADAAVTPIVSLTPLGPDVRTRLQLPLSSSAVLRIGRGQQQGIDFGVFDARVSGQQLCVRTGPELEPEVEALGPHPSVLIKPDGQRACIRFESQPSVSRPLESKGGCPNVSRHFRGIFVARLRLGCAASTGVVLM